MHRLVSSLLLALILSPLPLQAQTAGTPDCTYCEQWNRPRAPFKIYGNVYYVGTAGLSAILLTSPEGHVLLDGALPESAPLIRESIESLGFRVEDIQWILNSHAHFDHAGGVGPLQQASQADVLASAASAAVLAAGESGPDDPQHGELLPFPPVERVQVIDEGTIRLGSLELTAHSTPGHTSGGTTWTWRSCEGGACLDLVYADSVTPVSADGFLFSDRDDVLAEFEHAFDVIEQLSCDILLTPHPQASKFWERVRMREEGAVDALIDTDACADYAAAAKQLLARRLAAEEAEK